MKGRFGSFFDKARRSLLAAERLLRDGDHDFALSRAYYAMFYAAQALLLMRDVRRSKHSGVIAAFNEQFIQTGELSRDLFFKLRDVTVRLIAASRSIQVFNDARGDSGPSPSVFRKLGHQLQEFLGGRPRRGLRLGRSKLGHDLEEGPMPCVALAFLQMGSMVPLGDE